MNIKYKNVNILVCI